MRIHVYHSQLDLLQNLALLFLIQQGEPIVTECSIIDDAMQCNVT